MAAVGFDNDPGGVLAALAKLSEKVTEIATRQEAMHEDIGEVKSLAQATNGRVREVEKWRARLEGARAAVGWVLPALGTTCGAIVSGIAVYLLTH
jgi:hypothetical protein